MTNDETEEKAPVQISEDMLMNYKQALERAVARLPVKNGIVGIDSIWIETSIPYDLLRTLLKRDDLDLPENVDRINLKSNVRKGQRRVRSKRRRRR